MKIIDTTYYGLLISWFQEIHRICKRFNLKEEEIIEFFKTNERDSGGKHPRPVYYPGFIGGHCVIPNARLLNQMYPSPFIDVILESNEKRRKEIESEKS
jgi:UDP-N-acetyl-D-mannosaminuronate dehydrogenase